MAADDVVKIVAININLKGKDHVLHCFELDIKDENELSWRISKYIKFTKNNKSIYHPLCNDTVDAPSGWYKNGFKVKINGATYNGITPVDLSKPLMYKNFIN